MSEIVLFQFRHTLYSGRFKNRFKFANVENLSDHFNIFFRFVFHFHLTDSLLSFKNKKHPQKKLSKPPRAKFKQALGLC